MHGGRPSGWIVAAAALAALGCPPDPDRREGPDEAPEAAEARPAESDPAVTAAWSAELSGAERGSFQGATAVPERAGEQMTLRLSSESRADVPPVTMMVVLPAVPPGRTGRMQAENATVMVGASSYFHADGQPTSFELQVREHGEDRMAGSFSGTLLPDGPGEPLRVEGSFEATDRPRAGERPAAGETEPEGDASG